MSKNTATITESGRPESLSEQLEEHVVVRGLRKESNGRFNWPVSKASLQKCFVGILAILSALLIAEGIARSLICAIKPHQFGSGEFDAKMRIANTPLKPGRPCIYFLGTSHASRGVYADLIADRLRRAEKDIAVRNLACSASYPKEQILLLEHALKISPYPAMVIYECNQGGFAVPDSVINQYGESFQKSIYEKNLHSDWPILQRFDLWLKQNIYLVRYRNILKDLFVQLPSTSFSPGESVWNKKRTVAAYSDISPCGWAPAYMLVNPKTLSSSIAGRLGQFDIYNPNQELKKRSSRYVLMEKVFEFANKHNLKTAMLWLPLHPKFQMICHKSINTNDAELKQRMLNAANLDRSVLIDVHDHPIEEDFTDSDHLNAGGAVEISKKIADKLFAQSDIFIDPLTKGTK